MMNLYVLTCPAFLAEGNLRIQVGAKLRAHSLQERVQTFVMRQSQASNHTQFYNII